MRKATKSLLSLIVISTDWLRRKDLGPLKKKGGFSAVPSVSTSSLG